MASTRALLIVAVAVAAALCTTAHGASYTVGAPAGSWDLRTNCTRWASTITFRAGDQLVFKYARAAHDVLEVSRADHDACSSASLITTFTTGDDVVALPAGGVTRYFICGVPGHCDGGMRLAVRVQAGAAAAAPSPVATGAGAPRGALPPVSAARAPTVAMSPVSSPAAASARADGSLVELVLSAVVAALTALIC